MPDDIVTETDGALLVVTLNRPEKRNALNASMRAGLWDIWRRFADDDALRVAILTGAGDKAFCGGIDLADFAAGEPGPPPADFLPVFGQNIAMPKPVIAAINGAAYAGGFRLAQMCDLCVAVETATFAIPEARVGRGAAWAAPLARMIPPRVMMELLLTGRPVSAQRAMEIGFVNEVVAPGELMARARAMAGDILAGAPLFAEAAKAMVHYAAGSTDPALLAEADRFFDPVYRSEDAVEGPRAFQEKRAPRWRGR